MSIPPEFQNFERSDRPIRVNRGEKQKLQKAFEKQFAKETANFIVYWRKWEKQLGDPPTEQEVSDLLYSSTATNCQYWLIDGISRIVLHHAHKEINPKPISLELKQAIATQLKSQFECGRGISWGCFAQAWVERNGYHPPSEETIRKLQRLEQENVQYWVINGLCRTLFNCTYEESLKQWDSLNIQEQHRADVSQRTQKIEVDGSQQKLSFLVDNLPVRDYTQFVGRKVELDRIVELLSTPQSHQRISVVGSGGLGKTSLVLEAAYQACQTTDETDPSQPIFDHIIFTSAQPQRLTGRGILPRYQKMQTIADIIRAIARSLGCLDNLPVQQNEQIDLLLHSLSYQRTLLLVDNLETVEDIEAVLAFLYELPATVKVVITSREQIQWGVSIHLEPLPDKKSFYLIEQLAEEKGVKLDKDEILKLCQKTAGVPIAMVAAMGQLAEGYLLKDIIATLTQPNSDLVHLCFQGSFALINEQNSYYLLMALALFPSPVSREAIAFVAFDHLHYSSLPSDMARLVRLSLVKPYPHGRYGMLSLTRDCAIAQLNNHPNFEQSVRQRWISWYLQLLTQYQHEDWQEWQMCRLLETEWTNLRAVVEYCIAEEEYDTFRQLWQLLKGYTRFQGHWEERLSLIDWLIASAKQRQDYVILADSLLDKSRTLALIDQPAERQEAKTLLQQAWDLQSYQDINFKFNVLINFAVLHIDQQEFNEASQWLEQGKNLIKEDTNQLLLHPRTPLFINYYEAQISLHTGVYATAKQLYCTALNQAEVIHWERAITYIQDWLAQVAIQTGELEEAQEWLEKSLPIAQYHGDCRCIAFCQRSYALLEQARGNWKESTHWAGLAKKSFSQLQMRQKAEEMTALLVNLPSKSGISNFDIPDYEFN